MNCKNSIIKRNIQLLKDEKGVVTIFEAAIVFPVMFFVLFFIIYIGNAYYQIAQVDDCVMRAAIEGSEWIVNPQQYDMKEKGTIPVSIKDVQPYRYILGEIPGASIDKIEKKIAKDLEEDISHCNTFFIRMEPKITSKQEDMAEFHNYIVYSTFTTEVTYEVKFPIRYWGNKEPTIMKLSSCAEVSVDDAPEFIRNVDMAVDLVGSTKIGKSIEDAFSKINNFLETFANK